MDCFLLFMSHNSLLLRYCSPAMHSFTHSLTHSLIYFPRFCYHCFSLCPRLLISYISLPSSLVPWPCFSFVLRPFMQFFFGSHEFFSSGVVSHIISPTFCDFVFYVHCRSLLSLVHHSLISPLRIVHLSHSYPLHGLAFGSLYLHLVMHVGWFASAFARIRVGVCGLRVASAWPPPRY